jgi:hypothetical protein
LNYEDFWLDEFCQVAHLEAIKLIGELISTSTDWKLGLFVHNFNYLRSEVIESYVQEVGKIQDKLSAIRHNYYSLRV